MNNIVLNMKKAFILIIFLLITLGCSYAYENSTEVNGISFELPDKYAGGENTLNGYRLENNFSIQCIDDNIASAIGLWAAKSEYSEDLTINGHPVRYFYQYNQYVHNNDSHAYFATNESIYEISWVGNNITPEIEKMISDTPKSKIDNAIFYDILDDCFKKYKEERTDKLNHDAVYNYLESKYSSANNPQKTNDNKRLNEILLTYYN